MSRREDEPTEIEPLRCFEDLALPEAARDGLRQIATHVRQQGRIHRHWGLANRSGGAGGVAALFCGEDRTRMTVAAEALAGELARELHRVDLAALVGKYVGETERNLSRTFDAAEKSGAILLFDEADALFGKRAEVRDANDRYANIEVGYLLQRMESYPGLAILATNRRADLDAALLRRLHFVVEFPPPDPARR